MNRNNATKGRAIYHSPHRDFYIDVFNIDYEPDILSLPKTKLFELEGCFVLARLEKIVPILE